MKNRKTNLKGEIFRFVITGLLAAITTFIFDTLMSFILQKAGMPKEDIGLRVIATIVGFIFGVIVNYILSTKWVFLNIDKEQQNKHRMTIGIAFVALSAVAMCLSIGIMVGCKAIFLHTLNINIDTWMSPSGLTKTGVAKIFQWIGLVLSSATFWLYAFSFVLNTFVGMVFNYFTRKKFLFKEPGHNGNN